MLLKLGSKGDTVRSVQEMLNFLGFRAKMEKDGVVTFEPLKVDGDFGEKTESAIIDFQKSEALLRDGIVGSITMKALEEAYTTRTLELHSPGVDFADNTPDRHAFERSPAEKYKDDGYNQVSLRDDVAAAYREIHQEVRSSGGILTSSGGRRSLSAKVNPSRSATSFHYLGRALDLYIYSGMVNPHEDPYVIYREEARKYRIFARCSMDNNPQAALPEERTIENIITYNDRTKGVEITGHFLDLTALFEEHGFKPIRARRRFEEGASMMGAEWWHFQYEKGLISKVTTFGSELLKVYSRATLEDTSPWKYRDLIFGINWR